MPTMNDLLVIAKAGEESKGKTFDPAAVGADITSFMKANPYSPDAGYGMGTGGDNPWWINPDPNSDQSGPYQPFMDFGGYAPQFEAAGNRWNLPDPNGTDGYYEYTPDANGNWSGTYKKPSRGGWFDNLLNGIGDVMPVITTAAIGAITGGAGAAAMGGAGAGAGAAGGLGADGLAAADAAGGLLPEFGSSAAYGAGLGDIGSAGIGALGADSFGGLGSGMFGTGVSDIGSLMGTAGTSPFSLGTGLSGIGESLGASGLGDLFGSIGTSAANSLPDVLSSLLNPSSSPYTFGGDATPSISNTSPSLGTDTSQVNMGTGLDQATTDPFANETAKFARQDAMDPGSFWDQQMSVPTVDLGNQSFGDKLLQKAKDTAIKEGIKSLLGPAQPQMPVGFNGDGMPNLPQQQQLNHGAPVGALTQVQPLPNPFGYNNLTQTLLGHAPTIDTRNARFLSAKDFQ